jgi:hypothetical protein
MEVLRNRLIQIVFLITWPVCLAAQVNFSSSTLPIVVIDTDNQEILDDPRIVATMGIIHKRDGSMNHLSDPFNEYAGKISIEIRGNTSQSFPKKSYGLETQLENGENKNVSLLDLPEENDWILYAPYSDKSLIRNILAYHLSRELDHYAPRTRLCELSLNGEYMGIYVLVEKIKRDNMRVDISTLNPDEISGDDVTGGYIIKIDNETGNSGPPWASSIGGNYFQYEYPKYDDIVPEQRAYIKSYIDDFEAALTSEQFMDSVSGYRPYVDEGSFVDLFIVNELSKNIDGYMQSSFFYKDRDSKGGKLTTGPVWDYNLAFGNADYREGDRTDGLQVHINPVSWWWDRLLLDSIFITNIKERWYTVREKQFSNESILGIIDSLSLLLEIPQRRNFERWDVLGRYIWPNAFIGESFEEEMDFLKTWTVNRLDWLDRNLLSWDSTQEHPEAFVSKVYPNPFSDLLQLDFSMDKPGKVSLALYNLNGQRVASIVEHKLYLAGSHSIQWYSPDNNASVYILVLSIDGQIVSRKKVIQL